MQLTRQLVATTLLFSSLGILAVRPGSARAEQPGDDNASVTTTWYQEQRQGGLGGLTVIHPQASVGAGLGDNVLVNAGYSADVVSGATATVYSVDAVSSATTFSDVRHEGTLGFGLRGSRSQLGVSATVGVERDYVSLSFGGNAAIDLAGRNTTLGLSYSHSRDQVCDKDNADATPLERRALTGADGCAKSSGIFGSDTLGTTVWHDISIDTAQATLTQNVTPTFNFQLSTFGQVIEGFQSNPYRRVRVGGSEPQEHIPNTRARLAISVRVNKYLQALHAAAHVDLRGYSDTWGINAATAELAYSQYIGSNLLLRFHARLHQQSAATFFKDAFFYQTESTAGEYFTGDRELSPVRNVVLGGRLTILSLASSAESEDGSKRKVLGVFDDLSLSVKGDVYLLSETPADDIDANLAGTSGQFLTADQFVDAFALQLSVIAKY